MQNSESFFNFLKVVLRQDPQLPEDCKILDWKAFFDFCCHQSIVGIAFDGINRYDQQLRGTIDKKLLLNWYGISEKIKHANKNVNKRTIELTKLLSRSGFDSCILKGQGNALLYPNPYSRMPGDIDAWIDADRQQIEDYVKSQFPKTENSEQDIKFPIFPDVIVELHYKPQLMVRTKYKKRLFEFFESQKKQQFSHKVRLPDSESEINIPTTEFNVTFQMSHLMAHFFKEGIGLRQFIDYYYVLINAKAESLEVKELQRTLRWLGMEKFAKGVMWIEKELLGLDECYVLIEPDAKIGRVILDELLQGGNFGKFDERYSARRYGYLARGIVDIYRLLRLVPYFPKDSLGMIWRKFESQKWKLR